VAAVWEEICISSKGNHSKCLDFGAIVYQFWHLSGFGKGACFPWEQPDQEGPFHKIMIYTFKERKCLLAKSEMSEFYMEVIVSF